VWKKAYNDRMKGSSKIVSAFAAGLVVASLPYTLLSGRVDAQAAGPQQGRPPQQGGGFGQGGPGGGPGGGMPMNFPPVNSMVTMNGFVFASAGNIVYKIDPESMRISGETALMPKQRGNRQPGGQGGGQGGGQQFLK
jgi:hypothetical protein